MYKKIILILCLFLLTGCTGTYTVTIDEENIRESMSIIEEDQDTVYQAAYQYKKNTLDGYTRSYSYLNEYTEYMQDYFVDNYYLNKDNFSRDNYVASNGIYSQRYIYNINNSKKAFSEKANLLINNIIKDSLIINDTNVMIYVENLPDIVTTNLESFTFKVKVDDLEVESNNADSVEDNTYTWNFSSSTFYSKTISIKINRPQTQATATPEENTTNNSNEDDNNVLSILIVVAIYLVCIIVVINLMNKRKKLNFL